MSRKVSFAARMKRRQREKARRTMGALYKRMRAEGWSMRAVWIDQRLTEQIKARSRQLGIFERAILTAMLEYAVGRVSTSEIIRSENRWRQTRGLPCVQRWKHGPFDKSKSFDWVTWNKAYNRRQKKLKESA